MPDHTHMLIGLKPNIALSDLMRDVSPTRPNSLRAKDGSKAGSTGRKVSARFLLAFELGFGIRYFATRRSTMRKELQE